MAGWMGGLGRLSHHWSQIRVVLRDVVRVVLRDLIASDEVREAVVG